MQQKQQHKLPNTASTSKGIMSSKTKNGPYEILAAQKDAVTSIAGIITLDAIGNLKDKIGGIFTILKCTHSDKGQRYGYLVCVIPEAKYQLVIADNMPMYAPLANPGAYAVAAVQASVQPNKNNLFPTTRKSR
jgi:hypothetical protein